ncbi:diguanylate cyclase (GGDEF)-like protein [Pararhizobium capsulatum DSM 1112]|uniref:diguanylate cyclase n=1 Tax=Pararhizobium capsulatum DSM 1112 TaxID=1121113 RepID=A0ABU0BIS1_9HYPH|nr:diguanylate cyclase (GGDEF)-like protein [Pararhizobium capsulatum DSM 1112]
MKGASHTLSADDVALSRRRRVTVILWTIVLVATLSGFIALFGLLLSDQRHQDWAQAEVAANNLGVSVKREIMQTFHGADQALMSVREMLRVDPDFQFDPQKRRAFLGGSGSDVGIGEIYVLDAKGNLTLSSETGSRLRTNFANEAFFFTHERSKQDLLFTAKMVSISPLKEAAVILSRRLTDAKGKFSGVAVFSLRLSAFLPLFSSLELGEKGAISLYGTDGTLLLRAPEIQGAIGTNYVTTQMFWKLATAEEPFVTPSAIDGVERLYSVAKAQSLPLIIAVGLSVEEIYAGWLRLASITAISFAALAGCVVFLSIMLAREFRYRRRSEMRYRRLAHVDELTGLFNRRRFDTCLEDAFFDARETATPLSVVMVDVDRFKMFNDFYGHQKGDDCLRLIAQTIRQRLERTTDIVARYGGEEIAIILPVTDAATADRIAEDVRLAIENLRIGHARSSFGYVTASFGVATYEPHSNEPPNGMEELVACADEALYGAKRSGRNRVISHDVVKNGIPALPPADEAERLACVEKVLSALTPSAKQSLDHISQMASQALGMSLAVVTVVDAEEQRFVGRFGIEIESTSRDLAICSHALGSSETMVVLDAARDVRFSGNELVKGDRGLRFYAGAPLKEPQSGVTIGTLCVVDTVPHSGFTREQHTLLAGFAAMALEQIQICLRQNQAPPRQRAAVG